MLGVKVMSHRIDKIENLIKEEISLIFLLKLQNLDSSLVTITHVRVSADLKIAKVYVSIFEKDRREEVFEKIKSKTKFIRTELASRITIKFVPELKFFLDDTLDYVEKIEGLIKKIHENDDKKGNE
jgi:ribosome-binding factor A